MSDCIDYQRTVVRQAYRFALSIFLTVFSITSAWQQENIGGRVIQSIPDSPQGNAASLIFDKSFNTYHWIGSAFLNRTIGPVSIRLNEQLRSTLIRTDKKLITDNQILDLNVGRRISEKLTAIASVNSFILSDNKSIGGSISKAASHGTYLGVAYNPFDGFSFEPSAGIRFDNQLDRFDKGPSYLLGYTFDPTPYSGYLFYSRGRFQYDNIDPRKLESYNLNLHLEKSYFDQSKNYLSFSYYRIRRDFYFSGGSSVNGGKENKYNIETRSDNAFGISDSLRYNVGGNFAWSLLGSVFSREIDRTVKTTSTFGSSNPTPNSTISELRIEGGVRALYNIHDRLYSSLSFFYQEKDEKHAAESNVTETRLRQEERRNNKSRRTTLAGALSWNISQSDTVSLSGSAHLLRYDTPSRENDDDRDELLYLINLSTHHRISSVLSMEVNADVNLGHLVYLFASRSADNSWNRIIRLSPAVDYHPVSFFRTVNIFEVLANYTVYDFENLSSQVQSFVFRQFAFLDSSSISITCRLRLEWLSHIRLYERGEFRWNAFSERPVNYFEDKTYLSAISYLPEDGLLFSIGIRYFSQLRFIYLGQTRTLEHFLKSVGPTTRIAVSTDHTNLSISGWYEQQSQTDQSSHGYITMVMTLNVKI
jgi:hypothetical protein